MKRFAYPVLSGAGVLFFVFTSALAATQAQQSTAATIIASPAKAETSSPAQQSISKPAQTASMQPPQLLPRNARI